MCSRLRGSSKYLGFFHVISRFRESARFSGMNNGLEFRWLRKNKSAGVRFMPFDSVSILYNLASFFAVVNIESIYVYQ